ncbi:AMP-binding protein [Lonepinella sp. MS14436]|uniref:AMP-binding protein n=1 Tax=Lonepinella sp. MS14436 TaxID=3003619 RepID=UPI0036D8AA74
MFFISSQMRQQCQHIEQKLKAQNIQSVGLWIEDTYQFTCVLLACLKTNITVLLPPNLLAENQHWVEANADLFITETNLGQFISEQIRENRVDSVPYLDADNITPILLKTSGSTGNAQIIPRTASQLYKEVYALSQMLPFERGSQVTVLGSVSVQHLYGLTFRVFFPLIMGWQLGTKQHLYPETLVAETHQYEKVVWVTSPTLLNNMNLAILDPIKSQFVGIFSSGGALPENTAQSVQNKVGFPVTEIYGSSETGGIALRCGHSFWKPFLGVEIGQNEQGELWVQSPWIDAREQTKDIVEIEQGKFNLLGRADRIVKLGDKRISLVKIEQDLLKHLWVEDCYLGLHPEYQRPVAWIALSAMGKQQLLADRKLLINQLKQYLAQSQEKLALPRFWRFSDRLPRNSQSKIKRIDFEKICMEPVDEF